SATCDCGVRRRPAPFVIRTSSFFRHSSLDIKSFMRRTAQLIAVAVLLPCLPSTVYCLPPPDTSRGDQMIAAYFRAETKRLADAWLADVKSLDDWNARRATYRAQLFEMLGLDPLPERTDLHATVTGRLDADAFTVELLHFQSRPGLYVTGNLYV